MPDVPPPIRPWPLFRSFSGATSASLARDVIAGLTLAAIAVPEQMATARLGGFAPQLGFIAFMAAGVGFAVFGSSRQLSAGADSTITPIFAGSLALMAVAGSPQYLALAAVLAVLVGVLLVVAGIFKLGWIADLLSVPVITGFLAGIALHIVISQAPAVLGVNEGAGDVYRQVAALAARAGAFNSASLAIGLAVFAIILVSEKLSPRIPGALIAVVGATVASVALGLERHGVIVLGHIEAGLPAPHLPMLGLESLLPLIGLAFVVTLVVMMQAAATTRSFAGKGDDPDLDRDFIGLGAGSVLAGLFGAFPVNASPPRTAIVAQAGGSSQLSSLTAALAVLGLATLGAPLLLHVPAAALAGVLLFVAQRIVRFQVFGSVLKRSPAEFGLAAVTAGLVVALPIQTGVAVAIFLSLLNGVFTITRARPIAFERAPGTTVWWPASKAHAGETLADVAVIGFQAPLSFLNAYEFRRGVLDVVAAGRGQVRLLVLEASSIVEIDFTASEILAGVIVQARAAGMDYAVARLESVRAQAAFDRFGLTKLLGEGHLVHSVEQAIHALSTDAKA